MFFFISTNDRVWGLILMPSQYDKMAHLLRRAGFGERPDEVDNFLKQGFEATVEQLVNYEQTADPNVLHIGRCGRGCEQQPAKMIRH